MSRSSSRSESPWNPTPPTGTRLSATPSSSSQNLSLQSSRTHPTPPPRFAGDGFDHRRPIMSTRTSTSSHRQPPSSLTMTSFVDLTADSASPPRPPRPHIREREIRRSPRRISAAHVDQPSHRPPRFGRDIMAGTPPVIDLSSDGDDTGPRPGQVAAQQGRRANDASGSSSYSPEVTFISSRPVTQNATGNMAFGAPRNHQTAVANEPRTNLAPTAPYLRNLLGRVGIFRGNRPPELAEQEEANQGDRAAVERVRILEQEIIRQANGAARLFAPRLPHMRGALYPLPGNAPAFNPDFPDLNMNYENAAFTIDHLGGRDVQESTPPRRPTPPYKAPPAVKPGFTRKIGEEDVVVCPNCGDELGSGDDEVKQQVWVNKQCGHVSSLPLSSILDLPPSKVYCGECANSRAISKVNKKQARALSSKKTNNLRHCMVDTCKKPMTSKTAMVQIYL